MNHARNTMQLVILIAISLFFISPALTCDDCDVSASSTAVHDGSNMSKDCGGTSSPPPPETVRPDDNFIKEKTALI